MDKIIVKNGHKINMLTIVNEIANRVRKNGKTRRVFLCKCDCGNIKEILWQSLSSGRTFSCGCFQKKIVSEGSFAKKHGLSSHPLFTVWKRMLDRCYNENHKGYKYYGGKGITICDQWKTNPVEFVNWALANGWKKGLQIDKDIKGGKIYSPDNCLFVTPYVNLMNRSNTINKLNQNIKY